MFPRISHVSRRQDFFPTTEGEALAIRSALVEHGFDVRDLVVDRTAYLEYLQRAMADYEACAYPGLHFPEKLLEHYLSFELLRPDATDTYVDIASAHSPTPDIARRLFGCATFRQDLRYPPGINGDRIGGDAADIPVPDGFASKLTLHCSFEHFEQDADIRFIRALPRVLRRGGQLCIVPLYLNARYGIATDVAWWPVQGKPTFEPGAEVYYLKDYMSAHGRNYDVDRLHERIRKNLRDLSLTICYVRNPEVVDPSCYVRFVALVTRV
jgi:hypothetical protein